MTKLALSFVTGQVPVVVSSKTEFGSFKKWLERNHILENVFPREKDRKFETWVKLGEINHHGGGAWGPCADQTVVFCIRADKDGGLGISFGYKEIENAKAWYGDCVNAKRLREDK